MLNLPLFRDRTDAGEQLAIKIHAEITQLRDSDVQPIVLALPRGGLPVALPVARRLNCPLTVIVAKKISHPSNPELAMGAVTADGHFLWDTQTPAHIPDSRKGSLALNEALRKAQNQLERLTPACQQVNIQGAIAIIVDDGIATGMTMAVAAQALKKQNPAAVWLCAPVAPLGLIPWLKQWGDRIIILETPESFLSVSRFYAEFPQVSTAEAYTCLQQQA